MNIFGIFFSKVQQFFYKFFFLGNQSLISKEFKYLHMILVNTAILESLFTRSVMISKYSVHCIKQLYRTNLFPVTTKKSLQISFFLMEQMPSTVYRRQQRAPVISVYLRSLPRTEKDSSLLLGSSRRAVYCLLHHLLTLT